MKCSYLSEIAKFSTYHYQVGHIIFITTPVRFQAAGSLHCNIKFKSKLLLQYITIPSSNPNPWFITLQVLKLKAMAYNSHRTATKAQKESSHRSCCCLLRLQGPLAPSACARTGCQLCSNAPSHSPQARWHQAPAKYNSLLLVM